MVVSEKVKNLAENYKELSDDERHIFVELVAPVDATEISQEWLTEITKRAEDIDSGRVKLVEGDDFMRRFNAI